MAKGSWRVCDQNSTEAFDEKKKTSKRKQKNKKIEKDKKEKREKREKRKKKRRQQQELREVPVEQEKVTQPTPSEVPLEEEKVMLSTLLEVPIEQDVRVSLATQKVEPILDSVGVENFVQTSPKVDTPRWTNPFLTPSSHSHPPQFFTPPTSLPFPPALSPLLTCPICHSLYSCQTVTFLECQHSFCHECISPLLKANSKCSCPLCRQVIVRRPILNRLIRDIVSLVGNDETNKLDFDQIEMELNSKFPEIKVSANGTVKDEEGRKCPVCLWEVVDGVCVHCGKEFGSSEESGDDCCDSEMHSEEESDSDSDLSGFVVSDNEIETHSSFSESSESEFESKSKGRKRPLRMISSDSE